jgi:predicted RNA polymerase sigma factor
MTDDLALLQRIVARDTAALAELYDRHSRLLFGLILWTRAELYDERLGTPRPWLVRLARNCAIDRLRARRNRDPGGTPLDESTADSRALADIRTPEPSY